MPAVLAELETLGAIDAGTRARLVEDLKKTDPALWPQLLAYFKASVAYHQKYVATDEAEAEVDAQPAPKPRRAIKPVTVVAQPTEQPALLPVELDDKPLPLAPPSAVARKAVPDAGTVITDEAVQLAAYQDPVLRPSGLASSTVAEPKATETTPAVAAAAPVASVPPSGNLSETVGTKIAGAPPSSAANPDATTPGSSQPAVAAAPANGGKPGGQALPAEIDPLDWRGHLKAAIRGLERETAEPPATTSAIGRYAGLRLLYLVDGDRDGALRPLAGIPAKQQDFWSEQIFGLSTYLDAEKTPDDARRAAAAAVHLRDANTKLGDLATLTVRNLAFATEVQSYGCYKKFEKYEFHSGQEVLLYAEVENFKSASSDEGFHTALRSSYQILDNHGARVDQKEFEITEERCQNPRRDYFIRYFVWMPKRIYGGTYTLQLTIEDTLSQKIGQASIEFTVADKE
jgi:hypothetical protein